MNARSLREAIKEVCGRFVDNAVGNKCKSKLYIDKLITHFLFDYNYYGDLSLKFQSLIGTLGESVAGDEKLFHFTGNSMSIMSVHSKLHRIGLRMYKLVPIHCSYISSYYRYLYELFAILAIFFN
jgi:hypothetical protein